ncbi:uncharacterized protein At2g39795, mitochondrial-like [Vitis riparia]|uniref:uncharacterized protein At2g39795, mitochondrial-like n=1 Tax=Vitis riparia TaxID=96939 RepID=UPI00155ABD21|nr:uncharacterized protein At2g39795, mitochondrial-like [Vitis riparia]
MAMARIIRPLRRALISSSKSVTQKNPNPLHLQSPISIFTTRSYISEMRKSAFEGNILRLLRSEIEYELEHFTPKEPVVEYDSFVVEERPGEQWIRLKKKFGEKEEIKIEVTMFDGSIPVEKSPDGIRIGQEVELHITLIVNISKGEGSDVLEFVCSAWPQSVEIVNVLVHGKDGRPNQLYMSPKFKDLDDELQESLYEFLETRGIDDDLAIFVHEYMKNKDKTEFIRWMGTVKSFIEQK